MPTNINKAAKKELSESYIAEEIKSTDDFLNLREEWNKLVFQDPNGTVFQTWEWNFNVWKNYGDGLKNLNILLIKEKDGNLVGIAPFCLYEKFVCGLKIRIIELIDKRFSSYLDFIVKPEDSVRVYAEILSWLNTSTMRWDIVDLHHLGQESFAVKNYKALFMDFSFNTVIQQQYICPYLTLRSNRSPYENFYNPSLVKHLKRKSRKLEKDHSYRFLTVSNLSELGEYLDKLFDLHKKRRRLKLQLGSFHSEDEIQLYKNLSMDLLKAGWLKLSFLLVDERPAACLYNFEFKNKIYSYHSGLDPEFSKYSPGYLIDSLVIQEALKEGIEEYDFLMGDQDYKKEWTESYKNLYRIQIISSGFKSAILNSSEKLMNFFYNSRLYQSKSVRKLYFLLKSLGNVR